MLLRGRYEVGEPLGRSGMATVYRGHDRVTDRAVAIKIVRHFIFDDPSSLTQFLSDASVSPLTGRP